MRRLSDRTQGNKEGHWGKKGKMILKKFQYRETSKEFSVLIYIFSRVSLSTVVTLDRPHCIYNRAENRAVIIRACV